MPNAEFYISSTKYTLQERMTKRGKVYDVVFRIVTLDGKEKQKKLSGFANKTLAKQGYTDFVTSKCELVKNNPIKKKDPAKQDLLVGDLIREHRRDRDIIVRDRPRCGRRHVRQPYKYTEPRRLLGIFRKNIPHISRSRNVYLHYQNVVHLLPGSRKTRIRSFNVIDKGYYLLYSAHMHAARFFRDRRYFDRRARCRFHCNDSYRNYDAFLFR